jgi:hypothetical protein
MIGVASISQVIRLGTAKPKNSKPGPPGTSIDEKDAKEIIAGVQAMYDKVPSFIRPMLPAIPDVLRRIPPSAGKYTLNDLIKLLDWAYETGQLKK